MPFNLLKKYNSLLELDSMSEAIRTASLKGIFERDIVRNDNFTFQSRKINPTPKDGVVSIETLFTHLTTTTFNKEEKNREYDRHRSVRLHWIRYHLEEQKKDDVYIFSAEDKDCIRTYIYDVKEFYVIVLEPLRNTNEYYLLSAYHLRGKDKFKIENKYKKRRLPDLY
ncbi:MAG: hypothetical protein WC833_07935 [Bacteroidales bacterium]|jgi:hypothetical protein